MQESINLENILFLDIETVSARATFDLLEAEDQALWAEKSRFTCEREGITPDKAYEKAAIMAEFGKIICISVGFFSQTKGELLYRTTSFCDHDEAKLLKDFSNLLVNKFSFSGARLCGHNAKEFDFPYIARRLLINGMKVPEMLNLAGKKPWEVAHLDTMELWKFGDFKHYTSLNLLARVFGIPTPKGDLDGSKVGHAYYVDGDLDKIRMYCEKDTLTVARILQRFIGLIPVEDDRVIVV